MRKLDVLHRTVADAEAKVEARGKTHTEVASAARQDLKEIRNCMKETADGLAAVSEANSGYETRRGESR